METHPIPVPRARTRSMPASIKPTPAPRSPRTLQRAHQDSSFDVAGWNNSDNSEPLTKKGKNKSRPPPLAQLGLPDESALDEWLGVPASVGRSQTADAALLYMNQSRSRDNTPNEHISFPENITLGAGPARDPTRGKLSRGGSGSVISMSSNSSGSFCSSRGSFNSLPETTLFDEDREDRNPAVPPPFGFGDDDAHYAYVDQPSSDLYADVDQVQRAASAPPRSVHINYQTRQTSEPTPPPLPARNRRRSEKHHGGAPIYDEWADPAENSVPRHANRHVIGSDPTHQLLPTSPGTVDKEIEDCMAEILRLQALQVTSVRTSSITAEGEDPVYESP